MYFFSHFRVSYVLDWIYDTMGSVGQTCPKDDSKKIPLKKDIHKGNKKAAP